MRPERQNIAILPIPAPARASAVKARVRLTLWFDVASRTTITCEVRDA